MPHTLGTTLGRDLIDLLTHRDRRIRADWFTDIAVNALIGD